MKILILALLAMNCGTDRLCFTVDTLKTPSGSVTGSCDQGLEAVTFSGTCVDGSVVRLDEFVRTPCRDGSWSLKANLGQGKGSRQVELFSEVYQGGRASSIVTVRCPTDPTARPGPQFNVCE